MKEFLINYIEETIYFIALLLISISAYFISFVLGLFVTGLMLIVAEKKISKIKKILAERR